LQPPNRAAVKPLLAEDVNPIAGDYRLEARTR